MIVPHPEPDDYCYLTTTGRRTGQPHRIEIWYAPSHDTLYLLAGARQTADWVQNLSADPAVTVEVGAALRTERGRIIADAAEAERARALVFDKYDPGSAGDLTDWRDRALPVAIDPELKRPGSTSPAGSDRTIDAATAPQNAPYASSRLSHNDRAHDGAPPSPTAGSRTMRPRW